MQNKTFSPPKNLTPTELQQILDNRFTTQSQQAESGQNPLCLLDVRTLHEYEQLGRIPDTTLIPMHEIVARIHELQPETSTVVICQHGVRSAEVAHYLAHIGFQDVMNLEGGLAEWRGSLEKGLCQTDNE